MKGSMCIGIIRLCGKYPVGVFICRNPEYSPAVSPLYVVMEGTVLGQLVKIEESAYPGVVRSGCYG